MTTPFDSVGIARALEAALLSERPPVAVYAIGHELASIAEEINTLRYCDPRDGRTGMRLDLLASRARIAVDAWTALRLPDNGNGGDCYTCAETCPDPAAKYCSEKCEADGKREEALHNPPIHDEDRAAEDEDSIGKRGMEER